MGSVITFKTLQGEYKNGLLIIMAGILKCDTAIHCAGTGVKAMQVCRGGSEYFRQYNKRLLCRSLCLPRRKWAQGQTGLKNELEKLPAYIKLYTTKNLPIRRRKLQRFPLFVMS